MSRRMRRLMLVLAAGAGCSGGVAGAPGSGGTPGSASGGTDGNSGSGGNTTTGNNGSGNSSGDLTLVCAQSNLGTPLLRLTTREELANTLDDIFPSLKGKWTVSLPANQLSGHGFDNDAATTMGKQQAGALVDTALSLGSALIGSDLGNILPCAASSSDRSCADQFLTKYGKRLFRRPLTQPERDRYLTFFDASKTKSDFKTALKWLAAAVIQSPHAVYRSEIGTAKDGTRQLSPYEVATALAYTYTGTTPSESLLAQADSGNLGDLTATAKSLLATPAGKRTLQHFFEGYLGYTGVPSIQRPNVPGFSSVSADMVQETRAFIDDIVLQKGGGMKQLLTAPTTNPSTALAAFYGFPAPATNYASVTRSAGRGIGLLAQGSFLASHASSDSSSPTRRGLFAYFQLFCEKHISAPPGVPQISSPEPGKKTTRQRYEDVHGKIRADCAACHRNFDPMGFAFEHFDEGGRFRETESGLAIDSSGSVTRGSTNLSFTSQEEFAMVIANQPVIHQCVAAQLATYAFGSDEACLGAGAVPDLQAGSIGLADAYVRLAGEPHFTKRNAQ